MDWALTIVALALIAVAAVSKRLSGSPITPAILFVVDRAPGRAPRSSTESTSRARSSTVRALAEATLALVLFSDASRIDFGKLRHEISVPLRLLGIGLPLTIALGALAPAAIFDQSDGLARLSSWRCSWRPPTPPLARRSSLSPRVPGRIRQGLNIESGLNDGICVPLLFAAVAAADVESHISEGRSASELLLEEIGYGIVGGVVGGLLIGAVDRLRRPQGSDRGQPGAR